jgi:hypothetical protein
MVKTKGPSGAAVLRGGGQCPGGTKPPRGWCAQAQHRHHLTSPPAAAATAPQPTLATLPCLTPMLISRSRTVPPVLRLLFVHAPAVSSAPDSPRRRQVRRTLDWGRYVELQLPGPSGRGRFTGAAIPGHPALSFRSNAGEQVNGRLDVSVCPSPVRVRSLVRPLFRFSFELAKNSEQFLLERASQKKSTVREPLTRGRRAISSYRSSEDRSPTIQPWDGPLGSSGLVIWRSCVSMFVLRIRFAPESLHSFLQRALSEASEDGVEKHKRTEC